MVSEQKHYNIEKLTLALSESVVDCTKKVHRSVWSLWVMPAIGSGERTDSEADAKNLSDLLLGAARELP